MRIREKFIMLLRHTQSKFPTFPAAFEIRFSSQISIPAMFWM